MDVRVELERKLSAKELMLWTVVLEKTLKSPLDCKEIQPVHPKGNQSWIFIGRTDAEAKTWMRRTDSIEKTLMLGKIEGGRRREDGWMASLTRWTRVWVSSRNWWWTGKPGVLQSMGSQRVGRDWATELNWTDPLPTRLILQDGALLSSSTGTDHVHSRYSINIYQSNV